MLVMLMNRFDSNPFDSIRLLLFRYSAENEHLPLLSYSLVHLLT